MLRVSPGRPKQRATCPSSHPHCQQNGAPTPLSSGVTPTRASLPGTSVISPRATSTSAFTRAPGPHPPGSPPLLHRPHQATPQRSTMSHGTCITIATPAVTLATRDSRSQPPAEQQPSFSWAQRPTLSSKKLPRPLGQPSRGNSNTKTATPNTRPQAPSPKHQAPNTKHQTPGPKPPSPKPQAPNPQAITPPRKREGPPPVSEQPPARSDPPAETWRELRRGNERFVAGPPPQPRQDVEHRTSLAVQQRPLAAIFGCSDSRLSAEIIFDVGLGDAFVVRNAGQVISESVVGSLEYAVGSLGVPLILVLGHDECGAVRAAI